MSRHRTKLSLGAIATAALVALGITLVPPRVWSTQPDKTTMGKLDCLPDGIGTCVTVSSKGVVPDIQAQLDNLALLAFTVSHDRTSRFEQAYSSHIQELVLKNSRHVTTNQRGEYEYRPIFTNVLVVHPNIVLSMGWERIYNDDGLDKNGELYYLYFAFGNDGVNSRVTLAKNLRPAPLEVLSEVQREILRASITELAKSGCGVVIPGSAPLDKITKFDLYPCVQQVFARSRG